MGLVQALWNRELHARLQRIHRQIERQAASGSRPATPTRPRFGRTRNGLIPDAIARALADQPDGMRVRDVVEAVAALGEPVPRSSIKACLWSEAQSASGRFERVERGRYRLRFGPGGLRKAP